MPNGLRILTAHTPSPTFSPPFSPQEINIPCFLNSLNYYTWIYWDLNWELNLFYWHAFQQGFLKRCSFQEAEILRQLYSSSFPDLYRFSVQSLHCKTEMLEAFVIMQSINMLQGLIPPKVGCVNVFTFT